MELYKSIIAYDGTEFRGFQRQAQGIRTVQAVVENALRNVGWQERSIKAAGRTDAGVHARGQVIAFELAWRHETTRLTQALNANLPSDVAVRLTTVAPPDFHPRFSARRRCYRYTLITSPVRDPLGERYAWRIWPEPKLEAMEAVSATLVGRRDFAAFGRAPIPDEHTVRQIFRSQWRQQLKILIFEIEADAFLFHMVRRLVAAMIDVGVGRLSAHDLQNLLDNPELRWEGPVAEAQGLCLESVSYDE